MLQRKRFKRFVCNFDVFYYLDPLQANVMFLRPTKSTCFIKTTLSGRPELACQMQGSHRAYVRLGSLCLIILLLIKLMENPICECEWRDGGDMCG